MSCIPRVTQLVLVALCILHLESHSQESSPLRMKHLPGNLFWENDPKSFSVRNGEITIVAGKKTDMFRDPNVTYNTDNAPKLMFRTETDFVLTAGIEHSFTSKWDGGAIVLRSDSLNWIKFCFEKDYTGTRRVVSVVTRNISDDCNSVAVKGNKVFYKVAKAGNVITLYYSEDGKRWFLIRHLQFDVKPGLEVGFLAQSPTGKECRVKFSGITYSAKTIKDPYTGE